MTAGRIIRKYYEFLVTKLRIRKLQKEKRFGEVTLKYLFVKGKQTDTLAVVFSACTRPGLKARYNYVKTLDGADCSRLYILDDFGYDRRGSFYLGHMPEFLEQQAVISLVDIIKRKTGAKQLIFCGSCKGGMAALNIGSRFEQSVMIVGEPVFRLATEFKLADNLMKYWMGTVTEEKTEYMDHYLENQLVQNPLRSGQKIYFFYSECDEYKELHSEALLETIQRAGYSYEKETAVFTAHAELGLYFADYLKKKLMQILKA